MRRLNTTVFIAYTLLNTFVLDEPIMMIPFYLKTCLF